jgi:L-fuconolactonase
MSIDNTLIKTGITKVDSHQHFWQLSRGDYSWLTPELEVLYKDFLPKQLAPDVSVNGINQTILVQAAASEEETHFLLELAKNTKFVAGVVGWINMENPLVVCTLEGLAKNSYFKGIRPMLQDIEDINWILKDEFTPIFQFMANNQLTFDALIKDVHLSNIYILACRYPTLKIVVDHCAKPDLAAPPTYSWKNKLATIATCENVFIKFSGLLTEAPQTQVDVTVLQPYFDHIIDVFGPDRIMWGSDWPVLNINGDYDLWVSLTQSLLKNYSFEVKNKIWADNARNFYRLPAY